MKGKNIKSKLGHWNTKKSFKWDYLEQRKFRKKKAKFIRGFNSGGEVGISESS